MIFLLAEYFAARFFLASIATNLYVLKESKKTEVFQSIKEGLLSMFTFKREPPSPGGESQEPDQEFKRSLEGVSKHFHSIQIRPFDLIVDPILRQLTKPFCRSCCRKRGFQRREKMLA